MKQICGHCAWCDDGSYCRSKHKEVGYFWEKDCFTTQEEYDLIMARDIMKMNEENANKMATDTNTIAENANPKTKVCKDCGRELPIESFQRQARSKDGYMHICRECKRKRVLAGVGKEEQDNPPLEKKEESKSDDGFPATQDKYDRLQEYTAQELVDRLRFLGWDVRCSRTIEL